MLLSLLFCCTCNPVWHEVWIWWTWIFRNKDWFKWLVYFRLPIINIRLDASSALSKWPSDCIETFVDCLPILSVERLISLTLYYDFTWLLVSIKIFDGPFKGCARHFYRVRLSSMWYRLIWFPVWHFTETLLTYPMLLDRSHLFDRYTINRG